MAKEVGRRTKSIDLLVVGDKKPSMGHVTEGCHVT